MALKEKLFSYKNKINNYKVLDEQLENLIAIEFFDFIHESKTLKEKFYNRFDYLKRLSEDKNFIKLQNNLFETVVKITKLVNSDEVKKAQKTYNNQLINRLKKINNKKGFATLPILYEHIQNKNNYYQLGEKAYFMPSEEISIFTNTAPTRRQYTTIEAFIDLLEIYVFTKNHKNYRKYQKLIKEYKNLYYEFDKLIYRNPLKLHIKTFEDFFIFCIERHKREGYEPLYETHKYSNIKDGMKKVKYFCSVVIDDLIDDLKKTQSSKEKTKKSKIDYSDNSLKKIRSIIIVKPQDPETDKYRVIINNDYKNAKKIWGNCWEKLITTIQAESEVEAKKETMDYFNYNKKCKIYYSGKYTLTNILEKTLNNKFRITVEKEIISEAAYKTRLRKI